MHEDFLSYYEDQWDANVALTQRFFADMFGIDMQTARYHLMKMVDDKLICQVKSSGRAYYIHSDSYDNVRERISRLEGVKLI